MASKSQEIVATDTSVASTQLQLPTPQDASLEGRRVLSLDDAGVVEKQMSPADVVILDRFTIIGVEEISTQYGPRLLINALVPEDNNSLWVFSLGMNRDRPGKMDLQRIRLLEMFLAAPDLALADCALIALPTTMSSPAYSLMSAAQRDEQERKNQDRTALRQANRDAGMTAPLIPGRTTTLADEEIPI